MSDTVIIASISGFVALVTAVLTVINTFLVARANANIRDTKVAIVTLEKNTNSIKDALVEATGKMKFAEGLKVGTETAGTDRTKEQGIAALLADARIEAATTAGIVKGAEEERTRAETEKAIHPDAGK